MFPCECCHFCIHFEEDGAEEYGTGHCTLIHEEVTTIYWCDFFWNRKDDPFDDGLEPFDR
jgi:hypothetical protein